MNFTTSLLPDYTTFTINDYELAYDALSAGVHTISNVMCQPRAETASGVVSLFQEMVIEPSERMLSEMMERLRDTTFADLDEERRRRLLLVRFELDCGEGSLEAIAETAVAVNGKRKTPEAA